ncbi:biotin--[acetyl-CoA-carboxylase] ligase [Lagierella massiliensis]|uniref:biotin--[acetyl-CoA-carboxylase] ligase n=1 Tax=Lagierella massiliensis TaxID=1689303 RepID=UPI0006D80B4F|nr:biotin--[acetyl-CoA-carboxylase] ligase [Lagierella massiliensis]
MKVRDEVFKLLEKNINNFIPGTKMALELQVTRNAIWKAIEELRREGFEIEAKNQYGYRLLNKSRESFRKDILSLCENKISLEYLEEVSSTNDYLKVLANKNHLEYYTVIANSQSGGKGRQGKSFYSPGSTGVYLSMLLRPKFSMEKALNITTSAAVAVSKTIEEFNNKDTKIKWVNDIFIDNKKVCGILTEGSMDFEQLNLSYAVLGIGVNLFKPRTFPNDISNIAGYVIEDFDEELKAKFIARLIDNVIYHYKNIDSKEFNEYYREKSYLKGRTVTFDYEGNQEIGKVQDIDENYSLVIDTKDKVIHLKTGSVELKEDIC